MKNPKAITILLLFGLMTFIIESERRLYPKAMEWLGYSCTESETTIGIFNFTSYEQEFYEVTESAIRVIKI